MTDAWQLWSAIRSGQRCLYRANRHLRAILLGGNAHLDALVGSNLRRIVRRMFADGMREWHNHSGTPLRAMRDWLKDRGWTSPRPWVWKGAHACCDLSLPGPRSLEAQQHCLRKGWRADQWSRFLLQGGF